MADIIQLNAIGRKGNTTPRPPVDSHCLMLFTHAAQPVDYLKDLTLPQHAQVSLLEIIVSHYAQKKKDWDWHGYTQAEQDRRTQDMVYTVHDIVKQLEMYGIRMCKGRIMPAPIYCAVIMEVLGEGKTDAFDWQHRDGVEGFAVAWQARALDLQTLQGMPPKDQNQFNIIFTRQYLVTRALEAFINRLKNGQAPSCPLNECKTYRDATQFLWPASPLSADMALMATRVRNRYYDYAPAGRSLDI